MTKLYGLKVCSVVNPFGLDSAPRFSWKMSSDIVGEKQTAYEVTVFENKKAVKKHFSPQHKIPLPPTFPSGYGMKMLTF